MKVRSRYGDLKTPYNQVLTAVSYGAAEFAPILQQVEGSLGKVDAAGSTPARSSRLVTRVGIRRFKVNLFSSFATTIKFLELMCYNVAEKKINKF